MTLTPIRIILPTIFPSLTVNTWLFKDPVPTIIDCGEKSDKNWEALKKGLNDEGLQIKDIQRVIITHAHLDHMGMAAKIIANSNATIWVSDYVYDWAIHLEKKILERENIFNQIYQQTIGQSDFFKTKAFTLENLSPYWDEIPVERLVKFDPHGTINIGGMNWKVLYTPGHCINHTAFFHENSGQLISGDCLLRMIPSPILDAQLNQPKRRTKSLPQLLETFEVLSKLPVQKVLPGHFDPFENSKETILHHQNKIQKLKEQCFQIIQSGKNSVPVILNTMYKGRISYPTFYMIIGLLDLLVAENRVQIQTEHKLQYFKSL